MLPPILDITSTRSQLRDSSRAGAVAIDILYDSFDTEIETTNTLGKEVKHVYEAI